MAKCPVAPHLQMSCSRCVLSQGGQCCAASYAGHSFLFGTGPGVNSPQFVRAVVNPSLPQSYVLGQPAAQVRQRKAVYKVGV